MTIENPQVSAPVLSGDPRRFTEYWAKWFYKLYAALKYFQIGSGSPEGAVTAPVGTLYSRLDGTPGATLYIKETGAGNTGWTAVVIKP